MGDWRSGSAAALQAEGHRFKSCIAHHETQNQTSSGFSFLPLVEWFNLFS